MRSSQSLTAAMPLSARLSAYSRRAATAGGESGATAAWSRNAHRSVTGNCARKADPVHGLIELVGRGDCGSPARAHTIQIWNHRYSRSLTVFAEPARTPYDLNFRLFGFPVRIHPLFWLGAALLGASTLNAGLHFLLIWIARGSRVDPRSRTRARRRVSPVRVGFAHRALDVRRAGGAVLRGDRPLAADSRLAGRADRGVRSVRGGVRLARTRPTGVARNAGCRSRYLYRALILVNLIWGIFNLLPVFPLDGGQVSRELCEAKWRGRGFQIALKISIGVAAAVAIYSLVCCDRGAKRRRPTDRQSAVVGSPRQHLHRDPVRHARGAELPVASAGGPRHLLRGTGRPGAVGDGDRKPITPGRPLPFGLPEPPQSCPATPPRRSPST